MKVGRGAWATTHFTPEAEVRILGATQAEEASSKSKLRVDGKVIGKWDDEQRSASGLALYEKTSKCFLKRVYKGGPPTTTRFVRNGNIFKRKEETGLGELNKVILAQLKSSVRALRQGPAHSAVETAGSLII